MKLKPPPALNSLLTREKASDFFSPELGEKQGKLIAKQ